MGVIPPPHAQILPFLTLLGCGRSGYEITHLISFR